MKCCLLHSGRGPPDTFSQGAELIHPLTTAADPSVLAYPPPTNPSIFSLGNSENFSEIEDGDDDDSNAHSTVRDPRPIGQADAGPS